MSAHLRSKGHRAGNLVRALAPWAPHHGCGAVRGCRRGEAIMAMRVGRVEVWGSLSDSGVKAHKDAGGCLHATHEDTMKKKQRRG